MSKNAHATLGVVVILFATLDERAIALPEIPTVRTGTKLLPRPHGSSSPTVYVGTLRGGRATRRASNAFPRQAPWFVDPSRSAFFMIGPRRARKARLSSPNMGEEARLLYKCGSPAG